jgi:predicted metal-dependent hydrolase
MEDAVVQEAATKAVLCALRKEAEQHLPERLQDLARLHNFSYRTVSVRQLKSRWGSCDQDKNIKLNLYLMQLPWELIDYVLLHELVHTRVMQHGPVFWSAMADLEPNTPQLRKQIRAYKAAILH